MTMIKRKPNAAHACTYMPINALSVQFACESAVFIIYQSVRGFSFAADSFATELHVPPAFVHMQSSTHDRPIDAPFTNQNGMSEAHIIAPPIYRTCMCALHFGS